MKAPRSILLLALACSILAQGLAHAGAQATFNRKVHSGERKIPRSVLLVGPLATARLWQGDGTWRRMPLAAEELQSHLRGALAGEFHALKFDADWAESEPFDLRAAIEESIQKREPGSAEASLYSPRNDLLEDGRYRLHWTHTADLQRAGAEALVYVEAHAHELSEGAKQAALDQPMDWKGPRGSHLVLHWWMVETRGGLVIAHGQARRAGWISEEVANLVLRTAGEAVAPLERYRKRQPD